jgi:polyhydroxybutyrate depolymerase
MAGVCRTWARAVTLAVAGLVAWAAAAQDPREVRMDDGRSYLIARPPGVSDPPLILALHGGGGSPAQFARSSGLTAPALAAGFAVAYPAGTSRRDGPFLVWNALYCCGHAPGAGVDDLAFLDRVAADARARFGLGARVFVTGMSNGAMLAQTWAATRGPARVAAVASVAGVMDLSRVRVAGPVPLLHIHGTADDMAPYAGGPGDSALTRTRHSAAEDGVAAFRAAWGRLSDTQALIDPVDDGTRVIRRDGLRRDRPAVRLLTVEGGGHVWPGGRRARGPGATQDIDASAEVVAFFSLWRAP